MKAKHRCTYAQCREAFRKEFKLTTDDFPLLALDSTRQEGDAVGRKTSRGRV